MIRFRTHSLSSLLLLIILLSFSTLLQAKTKKPNILVIWGDDIGQFNVSADSNGMMGYRTPNIGQVWNNKFASTE